MAASRIAPLYKPCAVPLVGSIAPFRRASVPPSSEAKRRVGANRLVETSSARAGSRTPLVLEALKEVAGAGARSKVPPPEIPAFCDPLPAPVERLPPGGATPPSFDSGVMIPLVHRAAPPRFTDLMGFSLATRPLSRSCAGRSLRCRKSGSL